MRGIVFVEVVRILYSAYPFTRPDRSLISIGNECIRNTIYGLTAKVFHILNSLRRYNPDVAVFIQFQSRGRGVVVLVISFNSPQSTEHRVCSRSASFYLFIYLSSWRSLSKFSSLLLTPMYWILKKLIVPHERDHLDDANHRNCEVFMGSYLVYLVPLCVNANAINYLHSITTHEVLNYFPVLLHNLNPNWRLLPHNSCWWCCGVDVICAIWSLVFHQVIF